MFNKTFLGLPMWVWLVVIGMIAYNCYITTSNTPAPMNNIGVALKAEEFADLDASVKVYNFNTDWCGYSKQLQPEWDKFAKNNKLSNVKVIDVKCDNKNDPNFMKCKEAKYMVEGFPTVVAEMGDKVMQYSGPRTEEALHKWSGNSLIASVNTVANTMGNAAVKVTAAPTAAATAAPTAAATAAPTAAATAAATVAPTAATATATAMPTRVATAMPSQATAATAAATAMPTRAAAAVMPSGGMVHCAAPASNGPQPTQYRNQHIALSHNMNNVTGYDMNPELAEYNSN
jgi:thiol-disulfide isomerase/thioredoxin